MGAQFTERSKYSAADVADTRCGFCGKGRADVKQLMIGLRADVAICNTCVERAHEIVALEGEGDG